MVVKMAMATVMAAGTTATMAKLTALTAEEA
jgi:hypothetical protein